ncbi:amidase [Dyadobacter frigoris]|uniref:Amidase n=1 Tax=Dyadobacter frigoris TaxID=2576211 RepID=A0A4U6D9R4_9BACT|nr:amidase [Dyadobacter frigoris]TKT94250.1 amidase [Dyadobacter frigoris]GLU50559.1 amidase [Dyadobacter frigoris]
MKDQSNSNNDPIYYQEATTLAKLIRNKEISSVEVVQAHLDRIAEINPRINGVVTLMGEQALKSAALADKAVSSGEELGPLHGVPFSIKDAIDTAGVPTKRGSKIFEDFIPEKDATVVTRMKNAGAIPLMKTNIPEFSAHWESDNLVTGRSLNPWNPDRTPGGSSGGESAVIAAGLSPIGLGSDVAISLRGPAAFTGISALKATHGRVPYTGHFPQALSRFWHIGPMARTVRDVALGYSIINGADGIDGYGIFAKDAAPATFRIPGQKIRVGWVSDTAFGPVDPEITTAIKATAKLLADVGCDVAEVRLPFMENTDWLTPYFNLVYGELVPYMQQYTRGRESELHFIGKATMDYPLLNAAEYVKAEATIEKLRMHFAGYFQEYDVLLCPVNPMTATGHGLNEYIVDGKTVSAYHVMTATAPFNMTGLPALSVPVRLSSETLPINIQLVSRWFDEATILALGEKIQTGSEAYGKHPIN